MLFPRLMLASLLSLSLAAPALAETTVKPDDTIAFDLSAEDWVTTKTAHVTLGVEAAVSAANAGAVRAEMTKAVTEAAKADWRLTSFSRVQDQTGMERWSVVFDARLPESALNGLADSVKKASKTGMQIAVASIDFAPALDETEAARAALRAHIVKEANEQLTALNATLPGRGYRIAEISFDSFAPRPVGLMRSAMPTAMVASAAPEEQEHSEKLSLSAHVVFAAASPAAAH